MIMKRHRGSSEESARIRGRDRAANRTGRPPELDQRCFPRGGDDELVEQRGYQRRSSPQGMEALLLFILIVSEFIISLIHGRALDAQ